MEGIKLTPRLQCVADAAGICTLLADIGTDHAYIPVYMIQNGLAKRAIASDIVDGPVKIARKNVSERKLSGKIKVVKAPGLKSAAGADTIVIAGMGGNLICDILQENPDAAHSAKRLVLQPMTRSEDVRRFLHRNGFEIEEERLAKEENKIYNIITAKSGNQSFDDEFYYYAGKKLFENRDELLLEYLHKKAGILKRRADEMEKSQNTSVLNEVEKIRELQKRFLKEAERYGYGC